MAPFEAGTGKLEAVLGMGAAIDYMNLLGINNIQKYEKELSRYIISKFGKKKFKNAQLSSPPSGTLLNVTSGISDNTSRIILKFRF